MDDDWLKLKFNETYGMFIQLKKEIEALKAGIENLNSRIDKIQYESQKAKQK